MGEYIKCAELCEKCRYSAKGAVCDCVRHCYGCELDDNGKCRCLSVEPGEPCPYFEHAFGAWVSVKEDLPKTDGQYCAGTDFFIGGCLSDLRITGCLSYCAHDPAPHWQHVSTRLFVTHWMPLPEPPEEE